ncbi:sensor histidine kinase [Georgenia sp. Z1344]|uniref:sensor histidine kinase n=1 Tax=Georgenia sp. Z1344 TaxID=3416706 RepID=UPI003CEF59AE
MSGDDAAAPPAGSADPDLRAPGRDALMVRVPWPGHRDVFIAVLAALGVGFASLVLGFASRPGYGFGTLSDEARLVLMWLDTLMMCAAVAWRRVAPEASAVVVYLGALAHVVVGVPFHPVDVLVLLSLYSVTVHGTVLGHRLAMAGAVAGAVVLAVAFGVPRLWSGPTLLVVTLAAAGLAAGAWGLGLLRRTGIQERARAEEIERLAEGQRDRDARLAVSDERTRIARELHDVVAHTLSVVIAQADGGRYASTSDPVAAERALTTIGEVGRAALGDIRSILGVLRADDSGAALVPQPVDEDLDRLVDQVRDSGLAVSVIRLGASRPLPAGAGLMVFRIAQEALTNVLKHAGPAVAVTMLVQWTDDGLTLQIDDDGRGAAARGDGQGQGLVGMRERASVLGGTLRAGPRPGGGFRVRLELPVRPGAAASASAAVDATSSEAGPETGRPAGTEHTTTPTRPLAEAGAPPGASSAVGHGPAGPTERTPA